MRRAIFPLLLLAILSACSSKPIYPPAPAIADGGGDWTYHLGPGDSVNVFVWGNPEVSGGFPIRPDGKITMSLVEDLPVTGKTPTQLARELEKALGRFIQDPIVTVTVGGGNGPYSQQIRVLGQAMKPQSLSYKEHMSLLDLMIAVGGITDFADGNRASILRVKDGKPQQLGVRIDDLIKEADVSANVELRPGDVLIIPERWF